MKRLNRKGFTLIELLAVIVILGIIMLVAIPSMGAVTENARKDTFVNTAKIYINGARNDLLQGTYVFPFSASTSTTPDVTIIALSLIRLENSGVTSSYGAAWDKTHSYIAITNTGTENSPQYTYYFCGRDVASHEVSCIAEGNLKRSSVTAKASAITPIPAEASSGSTTTMSLSLDGATAKNYNARIYK